MKKTVQKIVSVCLCAVMLAGCSMPSFGSLSEDISEGFRSIGQLIGFDGGRITVVEQTEIIEYTISIPKCYNELSAIQQRMYRMMITAADDMVDGWINLGRSGSGDFENDVAMAFRALTCDRPDIFWLPSHYLVSAKGYGSKKEALVAFNYDDGKNSCSYLVDEKQRDRMQQELTTALKSYIDGAMQYDDDFKRELYIHDRLCKEVVYDTEGGKNIYSAYGALVDGVAVCEGYSRAMQLICNNIEIPCIVVYGESQGEGHMWNYINLLNEWYHLDITWDDGDQLFHTYFNASDGDIADDHIVAETYKQSGATASDTSTCYNFFDFACNTSDQNYFEYTGAVVESGYSLAVETIMSAHRSGESYAQLKITDADIAEQFKKDYNEPVARIQDRLRRRYGSSAPELTSIAVQGKIVTLYW